MPEIPLLGQSAANERAATDPAAAPQLIEVETAFIVFVHRDANGLVQTLSTPDLNVPLVVDHLPSADEVFAALAVVSSDLQAEKVAVKTINIQQAHVQKMVKQQQDNAVLQSLNGMPK